LYCCLKRERKREIEDAREKECVCKRERGRKRKRERERERERARLFDKFVCLYLKRSSFVWLSREIKRERGREG